MATDIICNESVDYSTIQGDRNLPFIFSLG